VTSANQRSQDHYRRLAEAWPTIERSTDYRTLVTANGNAETRFHRWFHMKEAYSHNLLQRLKDDESAADELSPWGSVLDPFAGSGTTCLSAAAWEPPASLIVGVERNPALRTIAAAKLLGMSLGSAGAGKVERAANGLCFTTARLSTRSATLNNPDYFDEESVTQLLHVSRQIESLDDEETRLLLKATLASSVEAVGRLRRDGRTLRFDKARTPVSPETAFRDKLSVVLDDMQNTKPAPELAAQILDGDARELNLQAAIGDSEFNRVVFSPPYPNNIDYTEVYKLENWVLNVWQDPSDMRIQRLATLRSHPSVLFPESYAYQSSEHRAAIDALIDPLLECVHDGRYAKGRRQLIRGYVDDMWRVLCATRRRASSEGSRLYCIVGNSVHGDSETGFVVAADVLIAAVSEYAGWSPVEIRIARHLTRRALESEFVRESIVVLEPC
jgi:hypothetical protein